MAAELAEKIDRVSMQRMADESTSGVLPAEARLLTQLQAGDATAFETLVRECGGRMLATIRRLLRNDEDAHDALQDAFLSAFKAIASFAGNSRLSTWLHRIAVNAALMKLRVRQRRHEQSIESLLPVFLADGHQAEPVSDWSGPAHQSLQRSEMRQYVQDCIAELPETYRTVLQLRDIEELDSAETAGLLGIEINAVKTRLHRARQALRTLLDRQFREHVE